MITVRLEPVPPFDDKGDPESWIVVNSRNEDVRRFAGRDRLVAQSYVTEFNITAYETDRRLRDASQADRARVKATAEPTPGED